MGKCFIVFLFFPHWLSSTARTSVSRSSGETNREAGRGKSFYVPVFDDELHTPSHVGTRRPSSPQRSLPS